VSIRLNLAERFVVAVLAAVAALTFFLPLFSIHVPIVGDQQVTGYETASKIKQLTQRIRSATGNGREGDQKPSVKLPKMPGGDSSTPSSLPLSIRFSWLIPVFIIGAFAAALLTLLGSLTSLRLAKIGGVAGTVCSVLALVHLTAMNSDMHQLLENTLQGGTGDRNPLEGLARFLGSALISNLDLNPGAALYVLAAALALATALVYSRLISRVRLGK
jgi:hypothetical protein